MHTYKTYWIWGARGGKFLHTHAWVSCAYAHAHVCMYVCMYVCMHVCVFMYLCMYLCMYVCTCV